MLSFRKDHSFRIELRSLDQTAHHLQAARDQRLERGAVDVPVFDLDARDAGFHCSLGNRYRNIEKHTKIERFGNQVVGPEAEAIEVVGLEDRIRHVLASHISQATASRQFIS